MRKLHLKFEEKVVKMGLTEPDMKVWYVDDINTVREAIKTQEEVV